MATPSSNARIVSLLRTPFNGRALDLGEAAVVIDLADEKGPAHVHEHRALVSRKDGPTRLDLLDDFVPAARDVNDGVVLVLRVPDRHGASRVRLVARMAVVEPVVVADEPAHADLPELVLVALSEELGIFDRVDRDLFGGALNMRLQHDWIIEIQVQLLKRTREDQVGIPGVMLIEREGVADKHRERVFVAPTGTSSLLTQTRESVRKPDCDDGVETADVDSELERGRRDDPEELTRKHLLLDLAPVLERGRGQVQG